MTDQVEDQPADSGHGDPPPKKPPARMPAPIEPVEQVPAQS